MLTQEQKDLVINAIKHFEIYYVDRNDDLDHLSSDQWLELIRDGYLSEDITMDWDADLTWIMDEAYKALDIEDRDEDELRDEIQDLVYEHCSNDPMNQLLSNTRDQDIIHVLWDLTDVELPPEVEDAVMYGEYDLYTFRVGILLGRTLEDMLAMFVSEDDKEWRKYYSIYNEAFGYTKLCVAYRISADDIPMLHTKFTNGDKVLLKWGDVGIINNSEWSGWMDSNRFAIDPVFTFDINQCYHDKSMWRYWYYDEVCWGEANDWHLILVEKAEVPLVTEDPLAYTRKLEAQYEATYRKGWCTYWDTDIRRHRNTEYINQYPCGTHCKCWQFWID